MFCRFIILSFLLSAVVLSKSSQEARKSKVNFLASYYSYDKFLPYVDTQKLKEHFLQAFKKLYPSEEFIYLGDKIIKSPLRESIAQATRETDKKFPLLNEKEQEKKIWSKNKNYKVGDFVVINIPDKVPIRGVVRKLTLGFVTISQKANPIAIVDIPKPQRYLFQGPEGRDKYAKYAAEQDKKTREEKRKNYFSDLQFNLLEEFLNNNRYYDAFELEKDLWGDLEDYVNFIFKRAKQTILIKNVIKKEKTKMTQEEFAENEKFDDSLSHSAIKFFLSQNLWRAEELLLSRDRLFLQEKKLQALKKKQKGEKAKEKAKKQKVQEWKQLLGKHKSGVELKDTSLSKNIILSLVISIVIVGLLFILLPKVPFLHKKFFSHRYIDLDIKNKSFKKKK